MGKQTNSKLLILGGIFLLTCALVYFGHKPAQVHKKPPLQSFFKEVEGYTLKENLSLNREALQMLDLDDYAFLNYTGAGGKVNLYIGYYATANKAYAAHSPLVCYPSRGWEISKQPVRHSLDLGAYTVTYEEITTTLGEEKELVLYWYQTLDKSNTLVYRNKIDMGMNKLLRNDERHAFVRVAVPFGGREYEKVKGEAIGFVKQIYPAIVKYFHVK